eukprot:TRINITY_DN61193_c0_g1_i1.p1 TRINITY_DN61193_c0_g1~~TRINITY_DN61193_c0_g1_i1.p1  ORF type:complete len:506 (+),score=91.96 TRINITY_DN61193_c0_g1_i1:46-1563(+)
MSHSKSDLRKLTARFEKCAERQMACRESPVKLTAAECDLLSCAEEIRDMCRSAATGDKDKFAETFGNCEELARLTRAMVPVELSEMHQGDQRWEGLKQELDMTKCILKDLGTFASSLLAKQVAVVVKRDTTSDMIEETMVPKTFIVSTAIADLVNAVPSISDSTETFAALLERAADVVELRTLDPSQERAPADWMLWMAHRAWMNDPELTVLDFSNLSMPDPNIEPRVAPKLADAIGHNTSITHLLLSNSNLQTVDGIALAKSLKKNTTLQVLSIDVNNLDSTVIQQCCDSLCENPNSVLEEWNFNDQLGCGNSFGPEVEEALAKLTDQNTRILHLGCSMTDAHWRSIVDKHLTRNNSEVVPATSRMLCKITLTDVPDKAAREIFEKESDDLIVARKCIAYMKVFPTKEQLQHFGKVARKPLVFSDSGPLLRDIRTKLINVVVDREVSVFDTCDRRAKGTLLKWTEANEKWVLDVCASATERFAFKSEKAPRVEFSDEFASWVGG